MTRTVSVGIHHDLVALCSQLQRPGYGKQLRFAGLELPRPARDRIPTRQGRVRCLRYDGTGPGCYVHFHGGAFVTRHPQMDDFWARFVVATTGVTAVLPDYDVAPQARYPVAHEQAYDVTAYLADERGSTVVGGFFGGGNLAASVALRARDAGLVLGGQLLGVPSLDVADDIDAKCAQSPGAMIGPRLLNLVRQTYFKDASRRAEPYASPLRAQDLSGVAPAMVVTGERDALRAEGDRYARRLAEADVPVEHVVAARVDHYFLHGAGTEQARTMMTRMAQWMAARTRWAA